MRPGNIDFSDLIKKSHVIILGEIQDLSNDKYGYVKVNRILKGRISNTINIYFGGYECDCFNLRKSQYILCLLRVNRNPETYNIVHFGRGVMPVIRYKNLKFVELFTATIIMNVNIKESKINVNEERHIHEEMDLTKIYSYEKIINIIDDIVKRY